MKKLLSAILCCVMLFGLMIPMTVSADAPAYDGATAMRIEFEDYASSVAVPLEDGTTDPTGPQGIEGGSTLMIDTRGAAVASTAGFSFDIQFTAPAGMHQFTYAHGTTFSSASFAVNGAALSASAAGAELSYPWGSAGRAYEGTVYFAEAGTQTLTVKVNYDSSRSGYLIMLDYFEVAPIAYPEVNVTNAADTTIDVAAFKSMVAIPTGSGIGKAGSTTVNSKNYVVIDTAAADATYTMEIPFEVAPGSAGLYNFNYWAGILSTGSLTVKVDETTLSASASSTKEAVSWAEATYYESAAMVNLTEGPHTLKLIMGRRTATNKISTVIGPFTFVPFIETKTTVTNAENTTIPVADYAYKVSIPTATTPAVASTATDTSGNKYLLFNAANASNASYTLEIPFIVAAGSAGMYNYSYLVCSGLEPLSVAIDSTTLSTSKGTTTYPGWTWSDVGVEYNSATMINLTEGDHVLKFTVSRSATGRIAKQIGAFTFKPFVLDTPEAVTVGEDLVKIEAEDYAGSVLFTNTAGAVYAPKVGTGASLSGGEALILSYYPLNAAASKIVMPVTLTKSGNYNFEYAHTSAFSNIPVTVTISNGTVTENLTEGAAANSSESNYIYPTEGGFPYAGGSGYYAKNDVYLAAGNYDITFSVSPRPDGMTTKYLDYISIDWTSDPNAAVEVSNAVATRIEMENHLGKVSIAQQDGTNYKAALGTGGAECSNGQYMKIHSGKSDLTNYAVNVPVNVAAAGKYKVTVASTQPFSNLNVSVDGTAVASTRENGTDATLYNMYGQLPMTRYTDWIELTPNTQYVGFILDNRGGTYNDFVSGIDYIEITPLVMPSASVSATEEMLIEAEAYASFNAGTVVYEDTGVAEGTGASGGKFLSFPTITVDPAAGYTMTIPFTADDEGLYAVEYVTTSSFDNCPITVYVDDTNATAGAASSTEGLKADMFSAYSYGGAPVKMTNAAGVVITAGDHNLVVKLGARPQGDVVKHLDYIKVTYIGEIPALESDITFADGVVTANVYLDEAVAGKAFIALYNGKEFVGMSLLADVDGAEFEVTMEDVEAGTFTEAKLFVWSDVESAFAPLIAPITKGFGNN